MFMKRKLFFFFYYVCILILYGYVQSRSFYSSIELLHRDHGFDTESLNSKESRRFTALNIYFITIKLKYEVD